MQPLCLPVKKVPFPNSAMGKEKADALVSHAQTEPQTPGEIQLVKQLLSPILHEASRNKEIGKPCTEKYSTN